MNKSFVTNALSLIVLIVGFGLNNAIILSIGLFAFSGAITNWLAVHMLFEKVPGLYGSGVVPAHFEDFKTGIHKMMMKQFFTQDNIDKFMLQSQTSGLNLAAMIDKVDLSPSFDALVETIKGSSFGSMLAMVGGDAALQPLKDPFVEKLKHTMHDIVSSDDFVSQLSSGDSDGGMGIKDNIAQIVESRLNELTPALVKQIIQDMIKQHLGWLVVWGGVFGGLIGLLAAFVQ